MRNTLVIFLSGLLFVSSSSHATLTLVSNSKSEYSIVIGTSASPSEQHGAEELQLFIEKISGCRLPIVKTDQATSDPTIFVGGNPALQSIIPDLNETNFGDEEYIIKTVGANLILAGGRLRGSMYAVYGFLEDVLGCRWFTKDISKIPLMQSIIIPNSNRREKPSFEYREPFWTEAQDPDWCTRNRVNSSYVDLDEKRGGKVAYRGVHTFYPNVPPLKWFADHPEYYSHLEGCRIYEDAELCLTNPEVAKVFTVSMRKWIDRDPEGTIFDVSQNDWYGPCACPHCADLDKREGNTYAASLIYFVNAVAERIEKSHPHKLVGTLPYKYTSIAPKTLRPRKNVVVRFVHTYTPETCDAHPITDCEKNANFIRDFKAWAAISEKLYLWDYYVDFSYYVQPYPNFTSIKVDTKWYARNGLKGIFCQGAYAKGGGGEFAELRSYVLAKILWDANRDPDRAINEFLQNVFGPAGWYIRQYIDLLEDKVAREWIHTEHHSPPTTGYLTPEIIQQADKLFDKAEELVSAQSEILDRVQKVRLPLRYAKLALPVARKVEGNRVVPISTPDAPRYGNMEELQNFMADLRRYGIQQLREGELLDISEHRLALNNIDEYKMVTVENPFIRIDILPEVGGRVYRLIHKKSGRNLLYIPTAHEWPSPMAGGYSEVARSGGNEEEYTCKVERVTGGQRILLTAYLNQRSLLKITEIMREIFLPDDKMELQFTTNAKFSRELQYPSRVSSSMGVTLGSAENLQFGFAKDEKYFKPEEPPEPGPRGVRSKTFVNRDIKGNCLVIVNQKENIGLIDTFDPSSIDGCGVSFNPKTQAFTFGLEGMGKEVKAGDVVTLKHTLKVVDNINEIMEK